MRNKSLSVLWFFIVLVVLSVVIAVIFLYDNNKKLRTSSSPVPTIAASSPTPIPSIILFPAGGETLVPGQSYTLKWKGGEKTVAIFLLDIDLASEGTSASIVDRLYGVTNTGSYQYTLPKNTKPGNYEFQIGTIKSNSFIINSGLVIPGFTSSCSLQNLSSTLSSEGAAGNIYVTVAIKNISSKSCYISGKNFPNVQFASPASNIKLVYKSTLSNQTYLLGPQESIYSLIHYPNGPQCSSTIKQVSTTVTYSLTQGGVLTFSGLNGNQNFLVTGCFSQSDVTQVDVSPFSAIKPGA